uniref:Uncharacterized protein n=1 Tax=Myotis myotis TaxID=51298 RepID=A0A7J8ALQ4_MYOMY|nr:hypothetical protein mMyoMyo1_007959 [Myotis myotis]
MWPAPVQGAAAVSCVSSPLPHSRSSNHVSNLPHLRSSSHTSSLPMIEELQPHPTCPHPRSSSRVSSPYPYEEQHRLEQPAPIQGAVATRAASPSPRSSSHTSTPPTSEEWQPCTVHTGRGAAGTCSLHLSDEQQLGKRPAPIRGAADTRAACSHLKRSSYASSPSPVREAAAM